MRHHPDLSSLRSDPALQRDAQAAHDRACAAWRTLPAVRAALADLDAYGKGAPLAECGALAAWCWSGDDAKDAMSDLVRRLLMAARHQPLGHVPLRHQYTSGLGVLQLAAAGRATASLVPYEDCAATRNAPASLCFTDGELHEVVLAGAARVAIVRLAPGCGDPAKLSFESRHLTPGDRLDLPSGTTKLVQSIDGCMVLLRIARVPERPAATREIRLADGRLVHRASGDRRESRDELMMAVLGRMGRKDAAPVMADIATDGSDHVRWQAVRECLALDAAVGFAALARLARRTDDTLSGPARALHSTLLAAYPQLSAVEPLPCHA